MYYFLLELAAFGITITTYIYTYIYIYCKDTFKTQYLQ